jgi:NADPH:quinone reductase-like Zn-dependent oxidoreductase
LLPDGKSSTFYNIQTRREKYPDEFKDDVQALFQLLAEGKLQPAIADCVPLDAVVEVHQRIERAEIAGKVVLRCSEF